MSALVLEIEPFNAEQPAVVNLTGALIKIFNETSIPYGQWKKVDQYQIEVEGKKFILQHGLNILYRAGGIIDHVALNIEDQPPPDETFLQIFNLDLSKPLITVKARYGDEIVNRLPYKGKSEPLLLYAPMDLPLDLYQVNGTLFGYWEGYVTKENTQIILVITGDTQQPLWGIELR